MQDQPLDEKAIFCAALSLESAEARHGYLKQVCGNCPELFQRVWQLLQVESELTSFLETPAAGAVETLGLPSQAARPGMTIDRYKLRELLGEGGMGSVYVAEQSLPIRRKVALKIIKPGMDSREVVARFEAERQTLALMDHPNISKVLDAGTTPNGLPYFVMELVKGRPITEYCDTHGLRLHERLELFVDVCQAVQHAHQKGIIHRDLKPSNVIVALHDTRPVVKVIDFGVAKAVGQQLSEHSLYTGFTQMLGTPQYMSPEQAGYSDLDIDTRSDVYSLGVLLYELLSGVTPLDRELRKNLGYDELRRIIREVEPLRPSTRLSTLDAAALSTVSDKYQLEPRQLNRQLRGELDWIVMKAIEKDRERRYATASGLAMDVQRYLSNEPVLAGPPSTAYRLRKLATRHRGVLTAIFLIMVALLSGALVAVRQAQDATAARYLADRRLANELQARHETAERESQLRLELYATDVSLAFRYWQDGDIAACKEVLKRHQPSIGEDDMRGFAWNYLRNCIADPLIITDHPAPILTADLSPHDQFGASGDRSGAIKIWELSTGNTLHTLHYAPKEVCAVRFSPDGQTLATAGQDLTIRLWDVTNWREVARLEGHERTINGICWSPDGRWLASAARDHTVRIWDVEERREATVLTEHTDVVRCVAWSPDGKRLASAGADLSVRLWDVATWQPAAVLDGHDEGLLALAFSPNGRWLASAGYATPLIVHDCLNQKEWGRVTAPGHIWSLAFSPNSLLLAVGGNAGRLRFCNVTQRSSGALLFLGDVQLEDSPGSSSVRSVVFDQGGQGLLTALEDSQQIRYDRLTRLMEKESYLFTEQCHDVDYERGLAATADSQGSLAIRNLHNNHVWMGMIQHGAGVLDARFSPSGELLASCANDHHVYLHKVASRERVKLKVRESLVRNLAFSPDGRWLAGGSTLGNINIWQTDTGSLTSTLHLFDRLAATDLAFSTDSQSIAAGHFGQLSLVDIATRQVQKQLLSAHKSAYGLALSPDLSILAVGSEGRISLWDLNSKQETTPFVGHQGGVWDLAFSPDGSILASLGDDRTVRLWHMPTRRELFTLLKSEQELSWLRFASPHVLLVSTRANEQIGSAVHCFSGDPDWNHRMNKHGRLPP